MIYTFLTKLQITNDAYIVQPALIMYINGNAFDNENVVMGIL